MRTFNDDSLPAMSMNATTGDSSRLPHQSDFKETSAAPELRHREFSERSGLPCQSSKETETSALTERRQHEGDVPEKSTAIGVSNGICYESFKEMSAATKRREPVDNFPERSTATGFNSGVTFVYGVKETTSNPPRLSLNPMAPSNGRDADGTDVSSAEEEATGPGVGVEIFGSSAAGPFSASRERISNGLPYESFNTKSASAERREEEAIQEFDRYRIHVESELAAPENQHVAPHLFVRSHVLLQPSCHLTTACWYTFRQHVHSHPGTLFHGSLLRWSTRRRVASPEEKRYSRETRKCKVYFVDVTFTAERRTAAAATEGGGTAAAVAAAVAVVPSIRPYPPPHDANGSMSLGAAAPALGRAQRRSALSGRALPFGPSQAPPLASWGARILPPYDFGVPIPPLPYVSDEEMSRRKAAARAYALGLPSPRPQEPLAPHRQETAGTEGGHGTLPTLAARDEGVKNDAGGKDETEEDLIENLLQAAARQDEQESFDQPIQDALDAGSNQTPDAQRAMEAQPDMVFIMGGGGHASMFITPPKAVMPPN